MPDGRLHRDGSAHHPGRPFDILLSVLPEVGKRCAVGSQRGDYFAGLIDVSVLWGYTPPTV